VLPRKLCTFVWLGDDACPPCHCHNPASQATRRKVSEMAPTSPSTCLACQQGVPYRRGVCARCYSRFSRQVNILKQTTWEELERAGKIRPAARSPWRCWRPG
jgi:predicted amidophosphoribosyltransferase